MNLLSREPCVLCIFVSLVVYGTILLVTFYSTEIFAETPSVTFEDINWLQNDNITDLHFTWICNENQCIKTLIAGNHTLQSQETCYMTCGNSLPLWPKPRNVKIIDRSYSQISSVRFQNVPSTMLHAKTIFLNNLQTKFKNSKNGDTVVNIDINLKDSKVVQLMLNTTENYKLKVTKIDSNISVIVEADNYFGARHALETLNQLIWFDTLSEETRILHNIEIDDYPEFPYRGLMVDVARNFIPLYMLKKIIVGMAASKLNTLHIHLTDSQSFPVILPSVPVLAQFGALNPNKTYTFEEMKNLVSYGRKRGVRVIFEIDGPSHMNAGWNILHDLITCGDDLFTGVLNPDNPDSLNVLQLVYKDLLKLSENNEIFHLGGDEVDMDCWSRTNWSRTSGGNAHSSLAEFMNKMIERANVSKESQYIVIWSSPLTNSAELNKIDGNVIVQQWLGRPTVALSQGKKIIYSTVDYWYLDCGFGPYKPVMGRNGNCDPYKPWQKVYSYRPWKINGYKSQTLGGEVCLWTEQVDIFDLETRIWPRAAAFAERMWSDLESTTNYDVYSRLEIQRQRLVEKQIRSAAIWPEACAQNPVKCGGYFGPNDRFIDF